MFHLSRYRLIGVSRLVGIVNNSVVSDTWGFDHFAEYLTPPTVLRIPREHQADAGKLTEAVLKFFYPNFWSRYIELTEENAGQKHGNTQKSAWNKVDGISNFSPFYVAFMLAHRSNHQNNE